MAGYAQAVGPIKINFTCATTPLGTIPSISLADANGVPAWIVQRNKTEKVSWDVPNNVRIDSIKLKTGAPPPLDPDGPDQGGAFGKSFKAKVQDGPNGPTDYHYNIFATCNPGGGQPLLRLKIDPEMIVP